MAPNEGVCRLIMCYLIGTFGGYDVPWYVNWNWLHTHTQYFITLQLLLQ